MIPSRPVWRDAPRCEFTTRCVVPQSVVPQCSRRYSPIMKQITTQLEDWRIARIPYLERVTIGGLGKKSRLLRILDHHARAIGLKPSQTVYHKWGKGGKRIVLRFSKSGDPGLEAAYSRHYVAQNMPTEKLIKGSPHVVAEGSCQTASAEIQSVGH